MDITSGKIESAQKVIIYGPEGIGKSTFASKFPSPLFSDTEGSTKHMDVRRLPKPTSWTLLKEEVAYVKANPTVCKTYIIDTFDWAERLCIAKICADNNKKSIEDFGYGSGYVYELEEIGRFLNSLDELIELGINVVLTAHAQLRKFEQPDEMGAYDRWELKLGKKTSSQISPILKEWADMILFVNYKTFSVATDDKGTKHKAQGGKRSMDRASGSGVFARDPDALIDLVELELNDDILKQEKNKAVCKVCEGWLYKYDKLYHASQDDLCSETQMLALCREYLENDAYECVIEDVGKARKTVESRSAWRIEGTLREFPKFAPVNLWFKYPVHNIDNIGVLKDIAVDDGMPTWKKNFSKKKTDAERKTERKNSLETAFEACGIDDNVTVKAMAEYMGVTEKTVRNRLKEHGGFWIDEGQVGKK